MGNRVSIQFVNGADKSVVLFSHWGGIELVHRAADYAKQLAREKRGKDQHPLDRLEPQTVMVDFVRYITQGMTEVEGDFYFGLDEDDGDNCDNGHAVIDLKRLSQEDEAKCS